MNYLAHAYLSFRQPELITGNLIADFVKGSAKLITYSPGIQQGIRIHRAIDSYTDQHPVTSMAKRFFLPSCGHYSGVFTDLVYDHFLATDTGRFSPDSLLSFSRYVYDEITSREAQLPATFLQMFQYMQQHNWLYNYRTIDGISSSFRGISRRTKYLQTDPALIIAVFLEHYQELQSCYHSFFPQLETYVENLLLTENR
ncbi:acyl carrier protein phosphodiesterase [Chitinophaga nivalis]|uniref:ACP phosphodiesterase n=1 Tax=Chitinophaga nivalis TaxID=2991709 RepID=A0ABT3IUF7_9BACT|nr:ACP phosphodiesterase [Chitinophaga nivalis]MCW3462682.1 ACP phosphodiesterase [Chitinophaga nivalis]MCW3487627.1 ACP phosphodiesterase [Chitinophaga nivalis]